MVCDNTLSTALQGHDGRVKIKHSRNSLGRVGDVRAALDLIHGTAETFAAEVRELCSMSVSNPQWEAFVKAHTGLAAEPEGRSLTMATNKAETLRRLYRHDERVAPWAGTAYGVLAAANTALHHEFTVRGAGRADRNTERAVMGAVDKHDLDVLNLLAEVAA